MLLLLTTKILTIEKGFQIKKGYVIKISGSVSITKDMRYDLARIKPGQTHSGQGRV